MKEMNCNHNQAKYYSAGIVHDPVAANNKCILQFKHKYKSKMKLSWMENSVDISPPQMVATLKNWRSPVANWNLKPLVASPKFIWNAIDNNQILNNEALASIYSFPSPF